jgi:uncharacterized protein YecT (DUF1311 family)
MSRQVPRRDAFLRTIAGAGSVILAALGCAACVQAPPLAEAAADCATPSAPADIARCALAEVPQLEEQVAAEEQSLVRLLETHAGDTGTGRSLLEEFQRAREAWVQYKEAECSFAYATALGGDLRGLQAATCLRDVLRERLQRLRAQRESLARQ